MAIQYTALFKENGERYTTIVNGIHYRTEEEKAAKIQQLKDDAYKTQKIENLTALDISEEDFNYYIGNRGMGDNGTGYILDFETGRPVSAPARVITLEEKLNTVRATYAQQISSIDEAISIAQNNNDQEYLTELQQERQSIMDQYAQALEEYQNE